MLTKEDAEKQKKGKLVTPEVEKVVKVFEDLNEQYNSTYGTWPKEEKNEENK